MSSRFLLWIRRRFLAGVLVLVPLVVTIVALVWIFQFVDGLVAPVYTRLLGREVPGLGVVTTAAIILTVGVLATNVIGGRIVRQAEASLMRIPVFRSIYAPVKQLIGAFSPGSETGFRRVVLVDDPTRGLVLGFLTREFEIDRGDGSTMLAAVYVPTNHLYLGDVVIVPATSLRFPDITVEQAVRIFLTGGMSLHQRIVAQPGDELPGRGADRRG